MCIRDSTWSVRRGGALVQQAFRDENGFELVHFGERGEPVSKARFSLELRWESTAYYMDGRRDQLPAAVLSPVADGLLLTEWNPASGKYRRIKLVPCALRRGTPEQSLADARLGEPRVWAETSEGDFCYCTEEEAALRRSLVERPSDCLLYTSWVYLETAHGGQRKAIQPGEKPEVSFALQDDELIAVYAYCNLHGLWKTEIKK